MLKNSQFQQPETEYGRIKQFVRALGFVGRVGQHKSRKYVKAEVVEVYRQGREMWREECFYGLLNDNEWGVDTNSLHFPTFSYH